MCEVGQQWKLFYTACGSDWSNSEKNKVHYAKWKYTHSIHTF